VALKQGSEIKNIGKKDANEIKNNDANGGNRKNEDWKKKRHVEMEMLMEEDCV
jgi:hypothetical protein